MSNEKYIVTEKQTSILKTNKMNTDKESVEKLPLEEALDSIKSDYNQNEKVSIFKRTFTNEYEFLYKDLGTIHLKISTDDNDEDSLHLKIDHPNTQKEREYAITAEEFFQCGLIKQETSFLEKYAEKFAKDNNLE